MMPVGIPLKTVHYDILARGAWCKSPYPGHPHGCPNFPQCIRARPDFSMIADKYHWIAVMEVFDLQAHSEKMKLKHPTWTDRQCRNPLYWQGSVRSNLHKKAESFYGDILLDIPEACGVDVFETMLDAGVILEKVHPSVVRKIMLVGFIRRDHLNEGKI